MTQLQTEIRRLPNGAIDIDYYHRRSSVLRSRAMTGFVTGLGPTMRPLIAFGALASILLAVAL